jgi:uncharacterized SAM-binding protein YcdF (DUF218 family)
MAMATVGSYARRRRRKRLLALLILAPLLLVAGLGVLARRIVAFGTEVDPGPAGAAIVLGAAVWDGAPSPVFAARIDHGIDLYQRGVVDYLVFTGGAGDGDLLAESEVARAMALDRGVPAARILIETESHITEENLRAACELLNEAHLERALIVSDPLHMKRAMTIARDIGLDAGPAPTPTTRYRTWRSKSGQLAYELFFYVAHLASRTARGVDRCR